jgi:hypothetical protein
VVARRWEIVPVAAVATTASRATAARHQPSRPSHSRAPRASGLLMRVNVQARVAATAATAALACSNAWTWTKEAARQKSV